jgi:hypothetical protein
VTSQGEHRLSSDFLDINFRKLCLMAVSIHDVLPEPAEMKTDKIHITNKDQ